MAGSQETARAIADAEGLIRGHVNIIRSTQHLVQDEEFYLRKVEWLQVHIAAMQLELVQLVKSHDCAHEIIAQADADIARIRREVLFLRNRHKIERARELIEEMNRISDELSYEDEPDESVIV
jgi:hypothetical protein